MINRIKENKVSFIAIIMFVTFGIAIFAGLGWSGISVSNSIDSELERCSFYDYEIMFPVPVTHRSIETFKNKEHIDSVEGSNIYFKTFQLNGNNIQAKIESITTKINRLSQIEGRLPVNTEEIVVEKHWAQKNKVNIGDKITFDKEDMFSIINHDDFIVCGLAESPEYISVLAASYEKSSKTSTPVDCIMFISKDAFNIDLIGGYSKLLIKSSVSYNELEQYIKDIYGIETEYTILTKKNNASLSMTKIIIDIFKNLKLNMALMFIIIGILVCFSSVSRLVYKDIRLIGTQKALGFTARNITFSYILYAGIASFIGCFLGILIARFVIEPLFLSVLNNTFMFEIPVYYISVREALILSLAEIFTTSLAAYIACVSTLKTDTLILLQGGKPHKARVKWFEHLNLWKNTSFFTKCVVNNLISDSRRVIASLIGIAGCTALIVCGITFSKAINDSFNYQFEKIQKYKGSISINPLVDDAEDNITDVLNKKEIEYAVIHSSVIRLKTPEGSSVVTYVNVGNENLDNMITPFTSDGKKHSVKDGIWLSVAFADNYEIKTGDTITYIDATFKEHSIPVSGIYEYYMTCPRILMSEEEYRKEYGFLPDYNTIVVSCCGDDLKTLSEELKDIDGYIAYSDYYANQKQSFSIIIGVSNAISYLYMVLAVLMAIFVLIDLFVMFVEEKKRELITLMINGYSKKYAKKYIYIDSTFLTIIGIFIGIICGIIMGKININSMQSDASYYLNRISWFACSVASVLTAVLTYVMIVIALKRIDTFKLSDIEK